MPLPSIVKNDKVPQNLVSKAKEIQCPVCERASRNGLLFRTHLSHHVRTGRITAEERVQLLKDNGHWQP